MLFDSYGRVPSCSQVRPVTQCNEFFHDVTIDGLESSTTYYYQIQAANGTTASHVMSFKTARAAGDKTSYTFGVLNDMGYTYAGLTHGLMQEAISNDEIDFFAHGGDLSYADDWNYGLLPCKDDPSSVCYNGADSTTSGAGPIEPDFLEPLPEGEQPTRGTPRGGDAAPLYETNWDVWQQWMNNITTKVPYMVAPGNHESGCVAHDANNLTANYLNHDKLNSTEPTEPLNYYSCPPSQRNFTTYQHRYTMPGDKTGGVGNMWYSWDYGMVHFVMLNAETDYPKSPESSFATDLEGKNYTHVKPEDTGSEDSGPFGAVTGDINDPSSYEQVQWVAKDLAAVDRCVTPWVVVIGHRPFYSSSTAGWQEKIRAAFENIFLENKVDAYLAGHIHFYERMRPLGADGWIDTEAQIDNHTYIATGNSITHLTNGAAGNLGSHDTFDGPALDITQHLDQEHFGFVKAKVNETALIMNYYNAADGSIVDHVTILKPSGSGSCGSSNGTATATATATASGSGPGNGNGVTVTTEVVTAYTTWCPGATEITHGSHTYTVTEATTLTITDCPCTLTHTISHPS